jgi:hypothetical protein
MRGLHLIGILLLLLGIAMAATTGTSFEKRTNLLKAQNVDMSIKENRHNNWPWLAGTVAVVGAIAIFVMKSRKPH